MANIKYRISSTEINPSSTTVKGSHLTNLEMDANIKSLNDNKAEISGTNATGTWPVSITGTSGLAAALVTPRLINGVSFNGTSDIVVSLVNTATFNSSGTGAVAGSTYTGAAALTVSYNTLGAAPTANPTFTGNVTLPSTTSIGTVSSTEIGYLDGVTSLIQNQFTNKVTITGADKSAIIPNGTTALRDASPLTGYFRLNTTLGKLEVYNTVWNSLAMISDITGVNSGTNTGDETTATIKSKLSITTLSGSNTGDQTSVTGSSGSCTGNAVNVTGTVALANGGTGATTALNAMTTFNRGTVVNQPGLNSVLLPNTTNNIWVPSGSAVYLPAAATTVAGDVIHFVNLHGNWNAGTPFTIILNTNTRINGLAENLVCDVGMGFSLRCVYVDGTAYWNVI